MYGEHLVVSESQLSWGTKEGAHTWRGNGGGRLPNSSRWLCRIYRCTVAPGHYFVVPNSVVGETLVVFCVLLSARVFTLLAGGE